MKIELTEEQTQVLRETGSITLELPKDEWEWKYPRGETYAIEQHHITSDCVGYGINNLKNGRYRIHKHNAENSLQLNKETNLIGAIAEQLFPEDNWKADWTRMLKYYVDYNEQAEKYTIGHSIDYRILGVHYMSEKVAKAVCEILNEGNLRLRDK